MRGLASILVSCALVLATFQGADARRHHKRLAMAGHVLKPKALRARAGTCNRSHRPSIVASASAIRSSALSAVSSALGAAETVIASETANAVSSALANTHVATPTPAAAQETPKPSSTKASAQTPAAQQPPSTPASNSDSNSGSSSSPSSSGSSSSASTGSSSSGGGLVSASDIQEYLDAHNSVRAQFGAGNLAWNNTLEAAAQKWADNCVFQHSGGSLGPFGENLAAGTGGETIQQGVKSWADEASDYNPSNPVPSHFTQMVWVGSTQLGCAVASCNGIFAASFGAANFYVCEYFPQGNIIGEFAQNVLS